jgi:hypothetical protein
MKVFCHVGRLFALGLVLLGSLERLDAQSNKFKGKVRIGYEYDSNVLELSTGKETASRLALLGWSGAFVPYEKERAFISLSFQGVSKIPFASDRAPFDVGSVLIQQGDAVLEKGISSKIALGGDFHLKFRLISGKAGASLLQEDSYLSGVYKPYMRFRLPRKLALTANYSHTSLQFRRQSVFNYRADGMGVSLDRKISDKLSAFLGYHFDVYRFRPAVLMERPDATRPRDTSHGMRLGFEHYRIFLSRVELGYETNRSNQRDAPFNFDNYQMNLILAKTLSRDLSLNFQYSYNIKNYAQKVARQINPLDLREKNFNFLVVGINKRLYSRLEADFKYSRIANRTNVSCSVEPQCLNFTKNLFTLTLGYRYGSK